MRERDSWEEREWAERERNPVARERRERIEKIKKEIKKIENKERILRYLLFINDIYL